jgi:hypothetical protein
MNFLKTKLSKLSEGKTKESRFSNKTGKKGFQGFLIWGKGHRSTAIGHQKPHQLPFTKGERSVGGAFFKNKLSKQNLPLSKRGTEGVLKEFKLKTEKPTVFQSLKFLISNLRFVCFLRPCILFLGRLSRKIFQITFSTKPRAIAFFLILILLPVTLFFLQNKTPDSNNQITVSSINSQEQFEIKKTKDSLALTSENSSITLNQIETEKKDFEIYSHPPKATNLKTQVVYFDDSDLNYQQAEITLKKEKQF